MSTVETGSAQATPESTTNPLSVMATPWAIVIAVPLIISFADPSRFDAIVGFAAAAFLNTLPYIAFAVILIAWLKAAGAEAAIGRAFEGRETRAIVLAALFGGLAPFCSCEVIPFIAGLLAVRCRRSWPSGWPRR